MKKQLQRISHLLIAIVLLVCLCAPAALADGNTLRIEVTKIYQEGNKQYASLVIQNYTGARVSFGWVSSCEVIVTTDKGMYSDTMSSFNHIPQGNCTMQLPLGNVPGTVQKIVITDLRKLDNRGLPGATLDKCVIYDTAKGITSFEGKFSSITLQSVMMVVVPVFMLLILIGGIVLVVLAVKANKKASQQYAPFGNQPYACAPNQQAQDQAMQMHQQAHQQAVQMHQQAVDTHQQFVDSQLQQQHDQFAQQSVTPVDQGGFTPPPGF